MAILRKIRRLFFKIVPIVFFILGLLLMISYFTTETNISSDKELFEKHHQFLDDFNGNKVADNKNQEEQIDDLLKHEQQQKSNLQPPAENAAENGEEKNVNSLASNNNLIHQNHHQDNNDVVVVDVRKTTENMRNNYENVHEQQKPYVDNFKQADNSDNVHNGGLDNKRDDNEVTDHKEKEQNHTGVIYDYDVVEKLKTYEFVSLRSEDPNVLQNNLYSVNKGSKNKCMNISYDLTQLPTASVIIAFHENERVLSLLHTIHSIVHTSPKQLLKEIILIDDNSKKYSHKKPLEQYIHQHFEPGLITFHRHNGSENLGLIQARLTGAKLATADVIVCMDAHMEVQRKWLEPLLQAIHNQRNIMATAMLDWMRPYDKRPDDWYYNHGAVNTKTTFVWKTFNFGFRASRIEDLDSTEPVQPFDSPMSIGTIWAMDREFFFEIGAFDEKMVLWGGENADLPIRVYLCGAGRVVNVPCSKAGHQEMRHQRDYRSGWRSKYLINFRRIGDVWLDGEYKDTYYYYSQFLLKIDPGDLTERFKLKEEKCKRPFSYFMENNYPELGVDARSFAWKGMINLGAQKCFYFNPDNNKFKLEKCVGAYSKEWSIFLSKEGFLRQFLNVFYFAEIHGEYQLKRGDFYSNYYKVDEVFNKWIHSQDGCVYAYTLGLCLAFHDEKMIGVPCNGSCAHDPMLQWRFQNYTHYYKELLLGDMRAFNMTKSADKDYYETFRNVLLREDNPITADVEHSEVMFNKYVQARPNELHKVQKIIHR